MHRSFLSTLLTALVLGTVTFPYVAPAACHAAHASRHAAIAHAHHGPSARPAPAHESGPCPGVAHCGVVHDAQVLERIAEWTPLLPAAAVGQAPRTTPMTVAAGPRTPPPKR